MALCRNFEAFYSSRGPPRESGSLKTSGILTSREALRHAIKEQFRESFDASTLNKSANRFARNPIYLGSMVLGLGMVGLIGDARLFPLYLAAFAFLYTILIPAEERFLLTTYGAQYEAYRSAVPRFIPRMQPWPGKTERPF